MVVLGVEPHPNKVQAGGGGRHVCGGGHLYSMATTQMNSGCKFLTRSTGTISVVASPGRRRRGGLGLSRGVDMADPTRGLSCHVPPRGLSCSTAPLPRSRLEKEAGDIWEAIAARFAAGTQSHVKLQQLQHN